MIKRDWPLLFSDYDLRSVLEGQLKAVDDKVRKLRPSDFQAKTDELLSATVASSLVVAPLSIAEDKIEVSTKEARIDVSHDFNRAHDPFGGPTIINGLEVTYHLPFAGDRNLLKCRPSTHTMTGVRAVVEAKELRFPYDSPDRDVVVTKKRFHEDLNELKQWMEWVNEQVGDYNRNLEPAVLRHVVARRSEIDRTKADISSLGYRIREDLAAPTRADLDPGELQVNRRRKRETARREYDVALSFAGEDREYVEATANALVTKGVTVFYDGFEQVNLWGKDLADHLGRVYGKDARFTVLFASQHYAAKAWPNHEKSFALARNLKGEPGRILPVRFDDTEIPGISGTIAYLDLRVLTPAKLAELIKQKVDLGLEDA